MVVNWSENLVEYEPNPPRHVFPDGNDDAYSPDEEELSQSLDDLLGGDDSIPTMMEEDAYFDALDTPSSYFESSIP
jgi:hypothetical protein